MSKVNPRIVYWLARLYNEKELTRAHRDVLVRLAVCQLDYGTGGGYCSEAMLAEGTGAKERTVREALRIARNLGLIERTRRGHRLGDGRVVSSEWQITYPPMPTGKQPPVDSTSTGSTMPDEDISTGSQAQSQPAATDPPSGIEVDPGIEEVLSQAADDADLLRSAVPDASEREIEQAITDLETRHAFGKIGSVRAYLRTVIRNGDAQDLIDQARAWLARDAASLKPEWCGECSDDTKRQRFDADDRPYRCPVCHPLRAAS